MNNSFHFWINNRLKSCNNDVNLVKGLYARALALFGKSVVTSEEYYKKSVEGVYNKTV